MSGLAGAAATGAALMMAHQVAGKATRDSTFLSVFPVSDLPKMVIAAAVVSILLTLGWSRLLGRFGPWRVAPAGFLFSAALHGLEWNLLQTTPRMASVLIYLHIAGFGAVLLSGFWSIANEAFDPRSAKRYFGRIAGGGTAGGIAGGLLAERVAVLLPARDVLLLLAGLHVLCGAVMFTTRLAAVRPAREPDDGRLLSPATVFRQAPYLRQLALLVLLGTASAAMFDYLFKSGAAASFGKGASLLRFFALFYTTTQVLTFLVQTSLTRTALEKLGISRTVGSLPMALTGISGIGLLAPAFPVFAAGRGLEYMLRGSLFRSGYELLYTPVAPAEKRVAKTIIDVGCDRAGDAVGAGLVQLVLAVAPAFTAPQLLGGVFALSVSSAYLASRLDKVYTSVIEKRLADHALILDVSGVQDSTTVSALLQTVSLQSLEPDPGRLAEPLPVVRTPVDDPLLARLRDLRSGDASRVRGALDNRAPIDLAEVPLVIRLLAWDDVAANAADALRAQGDIITGTLSDHLLDEREDFAVRRRLPRILARLDSARAYVALLGGLHDSRFEVRYQCARALEYRHRKNPDMAVEPEGILTAVEHELGYAPALIEARRLLDQPDADPELAFIDSEIQQRADKTLELVFSLLATILPREPLTVAFRALHEPDRYLKGLSVEYMESVLSPGARAAFRRYMQAESASRVTRTPDEILRDLEANLRLVKRSVSGADDGSATPRTTTEP